MASYKDAITAIELRMKANWTLSPVAYDNSGAFAYASGQDYVEFGVREGGAQLVGLPASHPLSTRVSGVIVALINIARGRGTQAARTYVDALKTLFSGQLFSGVQCRAGYPTVVGARGEHWTMRYTIPFFYNTSIS